MLRALQFTARLVAVFALAAGAIGCQRAESMPGDQVYLIEVPDMACQGCAAALTDALDGIEGVEGVSVDVTAKQVKVGVDSTQVADDSALFEAIRGAGYQPLSEGDPWDTPES